MNRFVLVVGAIVGLSIFLAIAEPTDDEIIHELGLKEAAAPIRERLNWKPPEEGRGSAWWRR